jgi:hypothetical protein
MRRILRMTWRKKTGMTTGWKNGSRWSGRMTGMTTGWAPGLHWSGRKIYWGSGLS